MEISANKFWAFYFGFFFLTLGLHIEGRASILLMILGVKIALILCFMPQIKNLWKTINMLRLKYDFETHKEALKKMKDQ